MRGDDEVIALLNEQLTSELTAINLANHSITQVPSLGGLDWKTALK